MPHECFADEIAIDFPSVEPALERMRHAFLGEGDEDGVLRAELRVSRREASGGRVIPIEVPIPSTCEQCGGRGETWTEPCGECFGTGASLQRRPIRLSVPAGIADGARLRFRVLIPGAAAVRLECRVAIVGNDQVVE